MKGVEPKFRRNQRYASQVRLSFPLPLSLSPTLQETNADKDGECFRELRRLFVNPERLPLPPKIQLFKSFVG